MKTTTKKNHKRKKKNKKKKTRTPLALKGIFHVVYAELPAQAEFPNIPNTSTSRNKGSTTSKMQTIQLLDDYSSSLFTLKANSTLMKLEKVKLNPNSVSMPYFAIFDNCYRSSLLEAK